MLLFCTKDVQNNNESTSNNCCTVHLLVYEFCFIRNFNNYNKICNTHINNTIVDLTQIYALLPIFCCFITMYNFSTDTRSY